MRNRNVFSNYIYTQMHDSIHNRSLCKNSVWCSCHSVASCFIQKLLLIAYVIDSYTLIFVCICYLYYYILFNNTISTSPVCCCSIVLVCVWYRLCAHLFWPYWLNLHSYCLVSFAYSYFRKKIYLN